MFIYPKQRVPNKFGKKMWTVVFSALPFMGWSSEDGIVRILSLSLRLDQVTKSSVTELNLPLPDIHSKIITQSAFFTCSLRTA